MKKKICQYLSDVLVEMPEEELLKLVEIPPEEKMGDLALPCFAMAKKMHKNPMQIASEPVSYTHLGYNIEGLEIYYKPYSTYLIFFVVEGTTVTVIRVLKDRMYWQAILRKMNKINR